jgi:hypothetical protein
MLKNAYKPTAVIVSTLRITISRFRNAQAIKPWTMSIRREPSRLA